MTDDQKKTNRAVNAISREVQRLTGQLTAVECALLSALATHNNLKAFAALSHLDFERVEATLLTVPSEACLTAFQEARARVNDVSKNALLVRGDHADL